jgi:hypothetical protein
MVDFEEWVKSLPPFIKHYGISLFAIGIMYSIFGFDLMMFTMSWD